jgi:hypothetical protein
MSGKLMKRAKSNLRRRNKRLAERARNLVAVPVPAPPLPLRNTQLGLPSSPGGQCQVCFNTGMFFAPRKEGDAALWYYCLCSHGSEKLASILGLLLELDVTEADRITAARYVVEPVWPERE